MKITNGYVRIFNSKSIYWSKNPECNLAFLKYQQSYLNDMLKAKGCLLLNDAYDVLGFPRTKDGAMVGWVYGVSDKFSDGCIDFGLERCIVDGPDIPIILNVDGYILDKLGEEP